MVREISVHRQLGVDVRKFFQHFWLSSTFCIELHRGIGDDNVDVSDWIEVGPNKAQRLLFFTRRDDEGSGTRCIETQSYARKDDGTFEIRVLVNPENPLGQVFRIEANWNVRAGAEGQNTVVDVMIEIECKKRLWGGYGNGMVEGMLEKSARKEYDDWFKKCDEEVALLNAPVQSPEVLSSSQIPFCKSGFDDGNNPDVILALDEVPRPAAASVFNRYALRYKASSVGHSAVRGAERFVSAFLEHGAGQEELESDRLLIHVPIDGKRGMLAPVFSPHSSARRSIFRRPLLMGVGLAVSTAIVLWTVLFV